MRAFLAVALLVFACGAAQATCSETSAGTHLAYSCTAGSTAAQINTVLNNAADEVVITLAAGTYSTSGIDMAVRNGATLICASQGACTFTAATDIIQSDHSCTGARTNLMRVSGMVFNGGPGGTARIWWVCQFGHTFSKVRIDHNDFHSLGESEIAIMFGGNGRYAQTYGVIDHNTFGNGSDANFIGMKNMSGGSSTDWLVGKMGTSENLFFEDNTINFGTDNPSAGGFIDSWRASSTVVRYNTATNSRYITHSYCHEGPFTQEIYNNTISQPDANNYRNIHLQGPGEAIIFNNTIGSAGDSNEIAIQSFRSDSSTATSEGACNSVCNGTVTGAGTSPSTANDGNRSSKFGYPCWHQLGRDVNATLKPVYLWNNKTSGGTRLDPDVQSGSWTGLAANCANTDAGRVNCHAQKDRDLYWAASATAQTSATSPFNGTSGVGFGTIARRPTTCSVGLTDSPDAGNGGVGYWATDENKLYRCSATNTWTLHYQPYTYPHPLQGGAALLPAPTNPRWRPHPRKRRRERGLSS